MARYVPDSLVTVPKYHSFCYNLIQDKIVLMRLHDLFHVSFLVGRMAISIEYLSFSEIGIGFWVPLGVGIREDAFDDFELLFLSV
jgi:hypothetical protein